MIRTLQRDFKTCKDTSSAATSSSSLTPLSTYLAVSTTRDRPWRPVFISFNPHRSSSYEIVLRLPTEAGPWCTFALSTKDDALLTMIATAALPFDCLYRETLLAKANTMLRHRRHVSLDSSAFLGLAPVRQTFTLQHSSSGPRTARLTAHTSPLALAPAISTPCSPQSDSDAEMEEELERMVSSVVNSPTEGVASSPTFRSASQLGLGLPSTMQGHGGHRRSMSTVSVSRSLLSNKGFSEADPKHNMGMRAAVGNYRKRVLTGELVGFTRCNRD